MSTRYDVPSGDRSRKPPSSLSTPGPAIAACFATTLPGSAGPSSGPTVDCVQLIESQTADRPARQGHSETFSKLLQHSESNGSIGVTAHERPVRSRRARAPRDRSAVRVRGDPRSVLELYRRALHVRRPHPALGAGRSLQWLDPAPGVLAFRREREGVALVCTVNTTGGPARVAGDGLGPLLLSSAEPPTVGEAGDVLLPADSTCWWQTG
ncbi:DUF3459 domain-containing protein [Kitasatospora sp. NPDC001547]|uniref:DUF3459 domain-containing protein n=1 Tax=Kitasatospora sp. NPDC001547 TaxID=3364015 RepID=UPI0036AE7BBE